MDFDKLHKKLTEKEVPAEIRHFIEECLRKEETVYITLKNGQKMEDPKQSRLSW